MFDLHPLSQQHNQSIKQGLPVYLKISWYCRVRKLFH